MNEKISDKIIQLRIVTRKACMCENLTQNKAVNIKSGKASSDTKNTLTLKSKFLYMLKDRSQTPNELISKLTIGKTNLALLAKQMINEGLIERIVSDFDKRQIEYTITELGQKNINSKQDIIEGMFKNILTNSTEYESALTDIDKVLDLMSYL